MEWLQNLIQNLKNYWRRDRRESPQQPPAHDPFPTIGLPLHLQERIVKKFDWQSYFRMQQTCHDMADFIRNCTVLLPDGTLNIAVDVDGSPCFYLKDNETMKQADLESLYGTRFSYVMFEEGDTLINEEILKNICDIMKKYRITSNDLDAFFLKDFSNEVFHEFLTTLRIVEISLDSRGSNRFELLLNAKALKFVTISLELDDMEDLGIMKKYMRKFNKIDVNVQCGKKRANITAVHKMLEYLRSEPFPNLQSLFFCGDYEEDNSPLPSLEELQELFKDFNPIPGGQGEDEDDSSGEFFKNEFIFQLVMEDVWCELGIYKQFIELDYHKYEDDDQEESDEKDHLY